MVSEGYFICPNCGNMITDPDIFICPNCTYDFGQLIGCPYKQDDTVCCLTNNECKIKSLLYEDCSFYINKFHLNKNPD